MRRKLQEIADVRSGYTFRKPPPHTTMHSYPVIRIKDVSTDGKLDDTNLATMQLPTVPERFFLRTGDILFCARGTRNQAAVCESEPKQAVVGSQFFVIHITREGISPQYIAWYINQPTGQRHFSERTSGSYVRMILVDNLLEMPVPVPPLESQRQIVALHELGLREQALLERLKVKRLQLLGRLCIGAAEERQHISKGVRE